MQEMEVTSRPIDQKNLIRKAPLETDTSRIISEPTVFRQDGKIVMVYGKMDRNVEALRQACKSIQYEKSNRTAGLKTESRIFGFRPRRVIRGDYCSSTQLSFQQPKEHRLIVDFGQLFNQLYQQWAPEVYVEHEKTVRENVKPDWIIPETIFTSGIVNKNNSLKYHLDAGNFKDCMSCMLVLRRDIDGGMLSIPEFDLRLDLQDSTYLIFDGQKILHGVTQITKKNRNSYRYSLVYYALQQMCNCLSPAEELKRVRVLKKKREEKRLDKTRTDL